MLRLYNSLSHTIEPVETIDGSVSVYVCGVTPYDTTHLGHAFTYVTFDVLVRYLRSCGITVRYAQNVTDIDDDILRKAGELGMAYDQLARQETDQFLADMASLNVVEPDAFVPATSVMSEIVDAVQKLLNAGVAYKAGGNVYFESRTFPEYGAAIHSDRVEMLRLAREHGGKPDDENKRDPLDFLLWQKRLSGEPYWSSPFGSGRPGWHIECTTIALTELGFPVDIHGGGSDLIFPHHASEIAQAEKLEGRAPFVRHWMHTAMVRMDGEKMSKSLGNMVFVRDLIQTYSADAIRLYLLGHHYREPFEWDRAELDQAQALADAMRLAAPADADRSSGATTRLAEAIADDFHTDRVVALLDSLATGPSTEFHSAIAWATPVLGLTLKPVPSSVEIPA
jgi:cysteinyl-tRNA synthetase